MLVFSPSPIHRPLAKSSSMSNMPIYEALAQAFVSEGVDTHFILMGDGDMHWGTAMKNLPGMSTYHAATNIALARLRGANVTDLSQIRPLFDAHQTQDRAEVWNIHVSDLVVNPTMNRQVRRGHGKM